jgi:hypothetical protein
MVYSPRLLKLILCVIVACCLASDLNAQKSGRTTRDFPTYGFSFRPLKDWQDIPQSPDDIAAGRIGHFSAEDAVRLPSKNGLGLNVAPSLMVLRETPQAIVTGEESGGLRGRAGREKAPEKTAHDYIISVYGGSLRADEFKLLEAEVSDPKIRKVDSKREGITSYRLIKVVGPNGQEQHEGYDTHFDVFTIQLPNSKIIFIWQYPAFPDSAKKLKKWSSAVRSSMKTFKFDASKIEDFSIEDVPDSDDDYADILSFHQQAVNLTPGWRLLETPSKNYLIKTNCEDRKSISLAIKRLEASRKLFEEDFPPSEPITNVSVVRICNTLEEFKLFSKMTKDGIAGYFRSDTEELVLYFGENSTGLDLTLAVMTHEGFHQYCHFLFNRAAAHRWYDEGHGDYYGAFKLVGSRLKPNEDMKGGLARIPEIKRMIANGDVAPLSEHLRYTHPEWQSQGPSGVSCYAQSFTIIYFLREGTRGRVSSKYFKKEYKDIIPNYIASLHAGYVKSYADYVEDQEGNLKTELEADADEKIIDNLKERISQPWSYLGDEARKLISDKAIDDSWGKIDEDEFEKNWLNYINNEL